MLIHEFPDLGWLKQRTENGFSDGKAWNGQAIGHNGWPTVIINAKTSSEVLRPNIKGPLSLFLNISGESIASVGRHRARINPEAFFLTNQGERYSLEIDKKTTTETFNIHFGHLFFENVMYDLQNNENALLDNPFESSGDISFYTQLYQRSNEFNAVINSLIEANKKQEDSKLFIEQSLHQLSLLVLKEQKGISKQIQNLTTVKTVTRQEIAKRLFITRDYIHSFYMQDIALDELAQVATMSKFHFLRHFTSFVNQTPAHYLTKVRIEKALSVLKDPSLSIHQISTLVGFKDQSSFSRAFKNYTGFYPTQIR